MFNNRLEFVSVANSVTTLGEKDTKNTTWNGSAIFFRFDSGDSWATWKDWHYFAGAAYFYGSMLQQVGTQTALRSGYIEWTSADTELYRMFLSNFCGFEFANNAADIKHFWAMNTAIGYSPQSTATVDEFTVNGGINDAGTGSGLVIHYNGLNAVVVNGTFLDNDVGDLDFERIHTMYLRDCTYSTINWRTYAYNSKCYEQNSVNIHVVDKAGNSIEGATITCEDKDGTRSFSVATDANGDIASQWVTYKEHYQPSTSDDMSPHTFTISKPGYLTHKFVYNFSDGKVKWEIKLYQSVYSKVVGVE